MQTKLLEFFGQEAFDMLIGNTGAPPSLYYCDEQ